MGNHKEAKKIFRKAYNCALKFYSFQMNNNKWQLPQVNYHLPRCVDHTIECFTDTLEMHEDWILHGMDNLDSLHPIGLSWKAEEFFVAKSEFADWDPKTLPKDIYPYCCYSTKNKKHYVYVFHPYCKEQVNKVFFKFAKAMHPVMVKKVYCIIYNSVLHYYNYCHYDVITHMTLNLPPFCLLEELKEYMDKKAHSRSNYMEHFREEDLHEWKDTDLVKLYISEYL